MEFLSILDSFYLTAFASNVLAIFADGEVKF